VVQIGLFFLLGCGTGSLTVREEHRLRVSENKLLLRKILALRGMR